MLFGYEANLFFFCWLNWFWNPQWIMALISFVLKFLMLISTILLLKQLVNEAEIFFVHFEKPIRQHVGWLTILTYITTIQMSILFGALFDRTLWNCCRWYQQMLHSTYKQITICKLKINYNVNSLPITLSLIELTNQNL